jgi:hypothetical protein
MGQPPGRRPVILQWLAVLALAVSLLPSLWVVAGAIGAMVCRAVMGGEREEFG